MFYLLEQTQSHSAPNFGEFELKLKVEEVKNNIALSSQIKAAELDENIEDDCLFTARRLYTYIRPLADKICNFITTFFHFYIIIFSRTILK